MTDGFHVAMAACAGLAVVGGILAWLTISDEVLRASPSPPATPVQIGSDYHARSPAPRCDRRAKPMPPVAVEKVAAGAR